MTDLPTERPTYLEAMRVWREYNKAQSRLILAEERGECDPMNGDAVDRLGAALMEAIRADERATLSSLTGGIEGAAKAMLDSDIAAYSGDAGGILGWDTTSESNREDYRRCARAAAPYIAVELREENERLTKELDDEQMRLIQAYATRDRIEARLARLTTLGKAVAARGGHDQKCAVNHAELGVLSGQHACDCGWDAFVAEVER